MRWVFAIALIAAAAAAPSTQQYFASGGASGLLGYVHDVDLNAIGETTVSVSSTHYVLRNIAATDCTNTDNTGVIVGDIRTATAGGGLAVGTLVSTIQDSSSPPNHPTFVYSAGAGGTGPDGQQIAHTATTLYIRVTTPRGAAMTCDFYVIGDTLP